MPYIATFLPSDTVFGPSGDSFPTQIPLKDPTTPDDLKEAEDKLKEVAKSTRWQINNDKFDQHGWLGITMLTPVQRPWETVSEAQIQDADAAAKNRGDLRRPLIIVRISRGFLELPLYTLQHVTAF
jgi:hypothetical protein